MSFLDTKGLKLQKGAPKALYEEQSSLADKVICKEPCSQYHKLPPAYQCQQIYRVGKGSWFHSIDYF